MMLKVLSVPSLRIAVLEHEKMQYSRPYRSESGPYTGEVSIPMLWIKDVPFSLQLSNSFLAPDDVDCLDAPVFAKVNHHPAQLRIGRTLYQGLSFGNLQTPHVGQSFTSALCSKITKVTSEGRSVRMQQKIRQGGRWSISSLLS